MIFRLSVRSRAPIRVRSGDVANRTRGACAPQRESRSDNIGYHRCYGVAAGAGGGDPKLKFTVGAFSAPCCDAKKGRD